MPQSSGRLARSARRARLVLAAALTSACLGFAIALLAPAGGAAAAPGASPSSSAVATPAPTNPTSIPASIPGIQTQVPGPVETPPPAPAAPGEPFPWAFVVFGVLGVALLIAWAVLGRRERNDRERGGADNDADAT